MCLIVDANLAAIVFAEIPRDDFIPVLEWLSSDAGKLVYGGKNAQELAKVKAAGRFVIQLGRAGKAVQVSAEEIAAEERLLEAGGQLVSDDPHVIALARISKARTLCTEDALLIRDFKNQLLVPSPQGRIYKRREHAALLGHTTGCVGRKSK